MRFGHIGSNLALRTMGYSSLLFAVLPNFLGNVDEAILQVIGGDGKVKPILGGQ